MLGLFMSLVLPVVIGAFLHWSGGKCRGRNARNAFRFAAWGSWLLLLVFLPIYIVPPIPVVDFLNLILKLTPSAICFLLAFNSIVKEMRAQQKGEYTDAA